MTRTVCLLATALFFVFPSMASAQQAGQPITSASFESNGRTARWQNWVFAGAALGAAVIGITITSLNQGSHDH